ncbi:Multi-sensor hybrid histidine kinase [uncultured delta proteobacterium]|uniref:histidine kinase n=1 Tax=uncultured delta proteobacterium TaxID=34034 RepID=A0A212KAB1_9DELT|nr:Multi-sensor hybrid histidine kinase [uncultured delta proteobacterium]
MDILVKDDALHNFTTIWEHVECGIVIVDAATRDILAVNPVAARMFGDDAAKMLGRRCHNCFCPAQESACPILDKGQTVDRSERVFVKADGKRTPIIKSVAKIQYQGRPALLESFTDISTLKEAEEKLMQLHVAQEASRAKSTFLSRMSHEMRTPMNAIIGMTKIAEHTADIDKLKYCLATINVSATHLLGLINDVLDMAKIEAGKFELDCVPFNLEDMLKKLCNIVAEQMEEKDITFRVSFGDGMRALYAGDELRLSQVITNLLSNAVKFTPKGGAITLAVDEDGGNEAGSRLRFRVSDTGIGMEAGQVDKLFTAFGQADASIPRRFGGTGLGLTISKNIVERMNGSIDVTTAPGEGSTFTVAVTLARAPEQPDAPIQGAGVSGAKVLVADADAEARKAFAFLRKQGSNRVDEAGNGAAAAALATAAAAAGEPYDAVFSVYGLPDMTAVDLAATVTASGGARGIVLVASFLQWSRVDDQARGAGIHRFVTRPLFPSAIVAALREMTGGVDAGAAVLEPDDAVPDFSRVTLLLAEDVAINRDIFASLLEKTNVTIDTAENGLEAVEKFYADPDRYDCIIMDVRMPEMDGFDATQAIRALDMEKARNIPIIAMTADVFREDVERCIECGMNDHLAKPIDERAVMEKIRFYCAK